MRCRFNTLNVGKLSSSRASSVGLQPPPNKCILAKMAEWTRPFFQTLLSSTDERDQMLSLELLSSLAAGLCFER